LPHVGLQVAFLSRLKLQAQDEIEKLDGVFEREKAPFMQVLRAALYSAQRKGLDRPSRRLIQKAFDLEVVPLMVQESRRYVAARALRFAEEQPLAGQFPLGCFGGSSLPVAVSFGGGGKSSMFCIWAMRVIGTWRGVCASCTTSRSGSEAAGLACAKVGAPPGSSCARAAKAPGASASAIPTIIVQQFMIASGLVAVLQCHCDRRSTNRCTRTDIPA
jgi:hypothetical protein